MPPSRLLAKDPKALLVTDLTQESCEAPLLEKGEQNSWCPSEEAPPATPLPSPGSSPELPSWPASPGSPPLPHRLTFRKPTKGILKKSSEPGGSQPLKKGCLRRGKTLGLRFSKDTKLARGASVGARKCQKLTLWQHLSLKRSMGYDWGEKLTEKPDTEAANALRQAFLTHEAYKAQKSKLTAGALLSLLV